MAQQMPLKPFRLNTRQRRQKVGQQAFAASSSVSQELPRVGYLNRIIVQVRGTMNLQNNTTLVNRGPHMLINRIKVNLNIGSASIVDLDGYNAYLVSCIQERAFAPDAAGAGLTTPNADIYAAGVSAGDNTWVLTYIIPIAANQGLNFDTGLINLQAPEVRCTVDITWGANTDAVTAVGTGTGFAGNAHIYYEYYEVPYDNTQQPPLILCRTLQESQAISATGDNIYTLPRMGVLMQLIHTVRANGSRSNAIDEIRTVFNKTDTVYKQERQLIKVLDRLETAQDLPTGVFLLDYWHSQQALSEGDLRDGIDTEEMSTIESIVAVTSGTTLGSGNNFLDSTRRIMQLLSAA